MNSTLYDAIDMQNSYRSGFWIGVTTGVFTSSIMSVLVGIYLLS